MRMSVGDRLLEEAWAQRDLPQRLDDAFAGAAVAVDVLGSLQPAPEPGVGTDGVNGAPDGRGAGRHVDHVALALAPLLPRADVDAGAEDVRRLVDTGAGVADQRGRRRFQADEVLGRDVAVDGELPLALAFLDR